MTWKRPPPRVKRYTGINPSAARAPAVRVADTRSHAVVPIEKFPYVRSEPLLANVKLLNCMWCRRLAPVDPAHSNWAVHGKGKSVKASDIYIAALCRVCHDELDQGSSKTEQERQGMWWYAHVRTVKELVARNLWPPRVPAPDIEHMPEAWA